MSSSSLYPDEITTYEKQRLRAETSAFMPTIASTSRLLQPDDSSQRDRAVFYNVYIPKEDDLQENALRIVKEQLKLKSESKSLQSVPLYYTLIGKNMLEELSELCLEFHGGNGESCHLLQYVEEGDESLTLQAVFGYCQAHPTGTQVSYIHNKGSFHPSERNEKFRTFLNHGVFGSNGQACQDMPLDSCNICGTRFATFPHYHMAGNMWTAQCDYIQKLIPPSQFPKQMDDMMEYTIFSTSDKDIPKPTFQQYSEEYPVGRGRYALEHWIASHPSIQPCDLYSRKYTHGYRDLPTLQTTWKAKLATAPRFDIHTFLKISQLRGAWYCGPARLWEYAWLYGGAQPRVGHWIWQYYLEPYKGCPTPMNFTMHNHMFQDKLENRTATSNAIASQLDDDAEDDVA